jgi:predicted TIM-barrel fold metal-dependent hydrolase
MSEAAARGAALAALLADLPIVDEHCHAPLRPPAPADLSAFLALFTESREAESVRAHVPHTLYFQRALQDLAALYGCAPEPAAVFARRQALSPAALLQRCTTRARLVALLVDTGYRDEESYPVEELNGLLPAGCRAWPLLRLERLLERLIAQSASFAALEEAFAAALADLRRQGYVALKSIRAYRCGLALDPPDRRAAAEVFPALRATARAGALRLTAKPLLDYFFWQACAAAAQQGLPLQLHTGFGDADLDLLQANPLLLRPALEAGAFRGVPVVLLHCYPYLREAGYLASLYSGVYLDLSLTVPLLGPACPRAVAEALELAPASKVLYGSDAAGLAESLWLGAAAIRRALGTTLEGWVAEGTLTPTQAERVARQILSENAVRLYGLPPAG